MANGKYTAQDATTAQKGIVQLSSATNSTSEVLAATPKAVKAAYDLANGKQAADATLTALAALATAADKLPYFTGVDRAALTALTSVGRAILGKTSIQSVLDYLSASKIKNVVIFGVTASPLRGCIELVEPKGATVCVDAMFLQKHRPKTGGYLIVYENGYLFYAPEKPFEERYGLVNDASKNGTTDIITDDNGAMINLTGSVTISAGGITTQQEEIDLEAADFSDALMWLKDGKKVARRGWNGENQFCWLVPEGQYPARMEAIKGYFPGDLVPYGAYFALKNAQGVVVPWVPSVGDLLACDWFVVE
ncbi:DUF2829 domain-containing protein [Escherichia coli]|nr:DUF2829 domain-containing protein [Escherichia coli]